MVITKARKKSIMEQFEEVLSEKVANFEAHTWLIEGVTPLLMNNPKFFIIDTETTNGKEPPKAKKGDKNKEKEVEKIPEVSRRKKVYDDTEECEKRLYKMADENLYVPSIAFKESAKSATSGIKVGTDSVRMVLAKNCFPITDECLLMDRKGKPLVKYEIDKRAVRIGDALIARCRPKFFPWFSHLELDINSVSLSTNLMTLSLNMAGAFIGVMDGRPDPTKRKTGALHFGRFKAKLIS